MPNIAASNTTVEQDDGSRWQLIQLLYCDRDSIGHKTAIISGDRSISYGELSKRSDEVRDRLFSAGIKKRSIVSVLVSNTVELVVAILGIVKADCIFVPIDPSYPVERIRAMALTVLPQAILIETKNLAIPETLGLKDCLILQLDEPSAFCGSSHCDRRSANPAEFSSTLPEDVVYIYFTSGSTGRPKGIAGSLKGLCHFISWEAETLNTDESSRVSQLTPCCFDPFLRDIFLPLSVGGTLCVPPDRESILDPERLIEWIEDSRVTVIHCTPSLFRAILNHAPDGNRFKTLEYIVLAGEPLYPADLKRWFSKFDERIQIVNLYGPTETTLAKFYHFVRGTDQDRQIVPVGKAIDGAEGLVLSDAQKLCPPGLAGEVYIRTAYRSHGYYGQPELNREVFIQNPFNQDDPGDLLYRSGDMGRVLPDGSLELLGRRDNQVKVRGVRVELEEVESFLREHEDISNAVVKDWDGDNHQKFLCAYIVSNKEFDSAALREFLSRWLPEAAIPSRFMRLDELPLNLNGKINRRALPDPRTRSGQAHMVAPQTHTERRLAEIWKAILNVPQIGIHDTFFSLGSDSLMAIRAVARMRKEFQVQIPLRLLFECPTVAKLAAALHQQQMLPLASSYPSRLAEAGVEPQN